MAFRTSLSQKVLLSIGSLVILALIVILYISNAIVLTSFTGIEKQIAETNIERVQKSIEGELDNLVSICGDWAPWDNARDFVLGKNPDFPTSNLTFDCLANLRLNFMIFTDVNGKILHIAAIDMEKKISSQVSPELINRIITNKSLLNIEDPAQEEKGAIILKDKVALIAAQPISNNLSERPVSGTLIIGRYLTNGLLNNLSEQTRLDITKVPGLCNTAEIPYQDNDTAVQLTSEDTIAGYVNIRDIDNDKYITLRINMSRDIYHYGRRVMRYFMTAIICTIIVILAALMFIMRQIVLKPINDLTWNVKNIHTYHNSEKIIYTARKDEIGSLARSFDQLMRNLRNRLSDLSDSQNLVRNIIDTAPAYIFLKDGAGRYLLANKAMAQLWNSTAQDMIGKTDMDFIGSIFSSAEQVARLAEDDRKVIQTGKALCLKDWMFAPLKGWKRWLQIHKIPITIKGSGDCVLCVGTDITERKKNEDAANTLNMQLVKITEKLEKTNDELGNFIHITSHDLKEPLRKISIFARILRQSLENKLNDDDAENLHFMIEGADRMTLMIAGLSAYSKISANSKPSGAVDINQAVEQVRRFELAEILENSQAVLDIPESLPSVMADPDNIRQLLQNLIENGIKYRNRQNKPHITITSKPAAGGMARIEITDNGIGIKPEYFDTIFTIFKQLHLADKYEGAGIGLAICKKIVERYDGQIGVESEPGKGSTFWFTLPSVKSPVCVPV